MSQFQLEPYINFNGDCADALALYGRVFNGGVTFQMKFGDMPPAPEGAPKHEIPEAEKDWIMHANFAADGVKFMASDSPSAFGRAQGNNVHLSIMCQSENEQTRVFDALSEGGQVLMPLQNQFWGARFGMLRDRFGVQWMFNYELPK